MMSLRSSEHRADTITGRPRANAFQTEFLFWLTYAKDKVSHPRRTVQAIAARAAVNAAVYRVVHLCRTAHRIHGFCSRHIAYLYSNRTTRVSKMPIPLRRGGERRAWRPSHLTYARF